MRSGVWTSILIRGLCRADGIDAGQTDSVTGLQKLFNEGGTINGLAVRINDVTLEVGVATNPNPKTVSSSFSRTDWAHVAVVFDNGALRLYDDVTNVA